MATGAEAVINELTRRYQAARDFTVGEDAPEFELFVRIADYVKFIETTVALRSLVEKDRQVLDKKEQDLEALGSNFLARLRRNVQATDLADFHFSRFYDRFLRIYHIVNYLNEKKMPPENFKWRFGFERAVDDLQAIRFYSPLPRLPFSKNMFRFSKATYAFWLERVQNALLSGMYEIEAKTGLSFDRERSVLWIGSKPVRISLKNDKTNAHYVLEYLFDHGITERAFYSEIIEEKWPNNRSQWRQIYRACVDIQEKVAKEAGINDFLDTTTGNTGSAAINPTYA